MKKLITILAFLLIVSPAWGANTLFEYYDGNLPSIAERAVEYKNIANDVYRGGFEQNIALLEYLESGKLGGNVPSSAINWTLAIPHSSSATTIDVSDFEDLRGNDIATTSMPTKIYFVIEPENPSNAEIVMCLAANGNETNTRFTSCTRGLAFSGTAETAVTANQKSHPSGANVIMTNVGQFFNNFVDITDDQTIAGVKTFSSIPLLPANNPTANNEAVRKAYADNIANQGAATSTEAKGGISELATQAEMSAG
ncbi:MAG: hypothetical protein U9P90_01115, partial [Patescibacteria group bacterium]|nr:hypothetical protein [Patescibacteria group bacterium]